MTFDQTIGTQNLSLAEAYMNRRPIRFSSCGLVTYCFVAIAGQSLCAAESDSNAVGFNCVAPSFEITFISQDLIELKTSDDLDGSFEVWITDVKALVPHRDGVLDEAGNMVPDSTRRRASPTTDTAYVRDGIAINIFSLKTINLIQSEGRVVVNYKAIVESKCSKWNSGEVVVAAIESHGIELSAGFLFGLGVSGTVKGQPELALSRASKHSAGLSSFAVMRYTSIAPIDTITTTISGEQFFNPFTVGGGLFDIDAGVMVHPWYNESQQEIYAIIIGGGFRSFVQDGIKEVFDRPRGFVGLHANILFYNSQESEENLRGASGYIELGFAYDEFWRTDIVTTNGIEHSFYEPQRIFFESELDLVTADGALPISALLTADLPIKDLLGGKMELNFGLVVGVSPTGIANLIGGVTKIFR
jgi:hypothetical protein